MDEEALVETAQWSAEADPTGIAFYFIGSCRIITQTQKSPPRARQMQH